MRKILKAVLIISGLALIWSFTACEKNRASKMKAPQAKKIKKEFNEFGVTRIDNYYWLNDRENPEVIDYLDAENKYTKEVLKPVEDLQERIFEEIVGRIKQTDMSIPYTRKGYEYYTRYEEGKEYPLYCRKKTGEGAEEEIMLNGNEMAAGHPFFQIGSWEVSQDNNLLVYTVDTVSRRIYTIYFKDLRTGEVIGEAIPNTSGNVTWANDNLTVFYSTKDETLRPDKIYRHTLGAAMEMDELVYHEDDPTFRSFVYKTKTDRYIVIGSTSTLSSEYRILDADTPKGAFQIFQDRMEEMEYSISHQGDRWLIRTNHMAKNFRLMACSLSNTAIDHWKELLPVREDVLLEDVDVFRDYYVITERQNGLVNFRIFDTRKGDDHYMAFDEQDYYAYTAGNPEYDSRLLRYNYTSLKTPRSVYDYDMETRKAVLRKQDEVVGGYDPDDYVTERLYATARDGERIPISIVYRKGYKMDGSQPLLLYGYGSYGYSVESYFRSSRLSLIDRGFAWAVAHIRGGQEMGRYWYEDGKLLKKKNTFNDFIDCGDFLVKENYTDYDRMFALGGSAGGLLVGAVLNERPMMFKGVIAAVPFVDVVTTMLDESIPLTTGEYDEWGNPNVETFYRYMLSYSPYDNVQAKEYTNLLVTTGLHDSQVQYWEPAKWVAKLRDLKSGNNQLLLWTNMDYGHGGASGRFEQYRETAMEYAFMLQLVGITE